MQIAPEPVPIPTPSIGVRFPDNIECKSLNFTVRPQAALELAAHLYALARPFIDDIYDSDDSDDVARSFFETRVEELADYYPAPDTSFLQEEG